MEHLQNPILWVVGGLALLLISQAKNIQWGSLFSWFQAKAPAPTTGGDTVLSAVEHFIRLAEYCQDCPEAHEALRKLWEHIDPAQHATHELYKPKEQP